MRDAADAAMPRGLLKLPQKNVFRKKTDKAVVAKRAACPLL